MGEGRENWTPCWQLLALPSVSPLYHLTVLVLHFGGVGCWLGAGCPRVTTRGATRQHCQQRSETP